MDSPPAAPPRHWFLPALAVLACFLLLGTRGLNEPDEGRYAEIAREMIERGDWLVPHLWYVPHLDKPPMTYWLVAASLQTFGLNEWAVRLPLALAGLSGAWATFLLARSIAGEAAARRAVLVLVSALLYWGMARMLTTDIFLTQFIAWSLYFFWRSWRALDALGDNDEEVRARAARTCFVWHVAAWLALAGGFLTKGPIALLIPGVAVGALLIFRRKEKLRLSLLLLGAIGGTLVFGLLALPWFVTIFQTVPKAFDFMVMGQAVGHSFGSAIDNRGKPFYFFIGLLAVGFLPWTPLLGWLWRRAHWHTLDDARKDAWVLLTAWAAFTLVFFSCTRAKLPAYILPLFPALAVLVAMRWKEDELRLPVARAVAAMSALSAVALPLVFHFAFKLPDDAWVWRLAALGLVLAVVMWFKARGLAWQWRAGWSAVVALASLFAVLWFVPSIETKLRSNQTLKPIGVALREAYRPGDAVVVWGRFAQGLPFYAYPALNATNRPFLGGVPMDKVPFEFPGNAQRLAPWLVKDEAALAEMLAGPRRVLVVDFRGLLRQSRERKTNAPVRPITQAGEWELYSNR